MFSLHARSRRTLKLVLVIGVFFLFLSSLPNELFGRSYRQSQIYRSVPTTTVDPVGQPLTKNTSPRIFPIPLRKPKVKPEQVLADHKFRADGLLEVNPDGQHPIYELIARAEKEWEGKFERASKTLDQAVVEYRRRYRREPPKGFDKWFQYAMENDVQLPDEYDQIYHDLEPFWGIEPKDLLRIQAELEVKKDSYTLGKNREGDIDVVTYAFDEGSYNQLIVGSRSIIEMLREIQDFLPPFRATFSPHDGPNRLTDFGVKDAVLQAAEAKKYLGKSEFPKITALGWISACPPDSPARTEPIDLNAPPPLSKKKTFIYNHRQSMDPCNHPNHFLQHGQFLSHNRGPTPQAAMVPEFSYCSTTLHHNIRIPYAYGWIEDIYPRSDDPPFDEKVDERLLWRGSNTGMFHGEKTRWQNSHRDFLVRYANDINGTLQVLNPRKARKEILGDLLELRKARINPAIMDIGFAGKPLGCSPSVCSELEKVYSWHGRQSIQAAGNYKYVLDVDGNGWSGRFKRLITSNALIFKSTIYPEWFSDRIAPWVHYVPIQIDLSDLHDALLFFRGDGNGEGAHEELGQKIAIAGREWSKTFWRREDLIAYFFRLLLEYARLMSLNRDEMSYVAYDED